MHLAEPLMGMQRVPSVHWQPPELPLRGRSQTTPSELQPVIRSDSSQLAMNFRRSVSDDRWDKIRRPRSKEDSSGEEQSGTSSSSSVLEKSSSSGSAASEAE